MKPTEHPLRSLFSTSSTGDNQHKKPPSSNKLSRDDWWPIISDWETSGLTQQAFCTARGVSFNTFSYYRNIFLQETRSKPKMVPIQVSEQTITKQRPDDVFMLHLPGGATLAIPQVYNSTALKDLLNVLEDC